MNSNKLIKALNYALYGNAHEKKEAEGILIQAELEMAKELAMEEAWANAMEEANIQGSETPCFRIDRLGDFEVDCVNP